MVSLVILADGTINMMHTLHQYGDQGLSYLPGSVGVACSPILSVSFEGMGCEPVLDLSATPNEAVSKKCTVVEKTILQLFWGKFMYVSFTTDWPGVSVGRPAGALATICLWVL
jgi:hypothetical protein